MIIDSERVAPRLTRLLTLTLLLCSFACSVTHPVNKLAAKGTRTSPGSFLSELWQHHTWSVPEAAGSTASRPNSGQDGRPSPSQMSLWDTADGPTGGARGLLKRFMSPDPLITAESQKGLSRYLWAFGRALNPLTSATFASSTETPKSATDSEEAADPSAESQRQDLYERQQRLPRAMQVELSADGSEVPSMPQQRELQFGPIEPVACNGVGLLVNQSGVDFECGGVTVTEALYDAIIEAQDSGSQPAIDALEDLLPGTVDFGNLFPEDTGISVNISQLFSGQTLQDIIEQLNITNPNEPIDLGELLRDQELNTTQLLEALPQSDIDELLRETTCSQVATSEVNCACPLDYDGNACQFARTYTCSLSVGDAAYQSCVASNAAGSSTKYDSRTDGDPPCLFFSHSSTAPDVQVPMEVSCEFVHGRRDPTCNGTVINQAFIDDQAAEQNVSVSDLPGTFPYYNFGCVELNFTYAIGDLNTTLAFTVAPAPLNLLFRPWNFLKLSDMSLNQSWELTGDALLSPQQFTGTLPASTMSPDFISGGRVYTEVSLTRPSLFGDTSLPPFVSPFPKRILFDQSGYVEPLRSSINWALLLGLLLGLVLPLVLLGAYIGYRWWKHAHAPVSEADSSYLMMKEG